MFTSNEVQAIPIFSVIPATDLERLAKSAADIQLAAGEWAVHEGDERAFYAVISGKIEVVKLFDGVARTLGWRVPGTIFGGPRWHLGRRFRRVTGRYKRRASCAWTPNNITHWPPLLRNLL
jgi:hypothetical protein